MKIINLKINIPKILITICIALAIIFVLLAVMRFLDFATDRKIIMTNENYTTILKDCHKNIDDYLNKEICMIGYIFRAADFKENEIVIARDMLINETEAQIVGFLCKYPYACEYENNMWVEVTGKIIRGEYHGEIPIVEIKTIKNITTPEDIFVKKP